MYAWGPPCLFRFDFSSKNLPLDRRGIDGEDIDSLRKLPGAFDGVLAHARFSGNAVSRRDQSPILGI